MTDLFDLAENPPCEVAATCSGPDEGCPYDAYFAGTLKDAKRAGWRHIEEDDVECSWWTHLGVCPNCWPSYKKQEEDWKRYCKAQKEQKK